MDTGKDVLRRKLQETPEMEGRFRRALTFLEPTNVRSVARPTSQALKPNISSFSFFQNLSACFILFSLRYCRVNVDKVQVLKNECLAAFEYLKGVEGTETSEYQITVLLTSDTAKDDGPGLDIFTYVQALPFVEATVAGICSES